MSALQGVIFITFDINTKETEFIRNDNITDYDTNATNIYVQSKYKKSDGETVYLSPAEIANYNFSLYTMKPLTNNVSEITGEVTNELIEQVRGGVIKFVIPKACTNRSGIVKCELHINKEKEKIASTRFILDVQQSLVTKFNDSLLDDEDFPVLKQLILEIQKASNINDSTASSVTTYSGNKIENIKEDLSSQIKDEAKNLSDRIDNIVANAGDGTKDTEIIDARGGDVCLNNRFVGIENGEYINEVSFEKIKKARPKGESYAIDNFSTWSKWSAVTGDTDKVTSLENGGIAISIGEALTSNLVLSQNGVNLQGKKLTLKFDITVTSMINADDRFTIALNNSVTIKTIHLSEFKIGKTTTVSIDFNDDKLTIGKLGLVLNACCNCKLENLKLGDCMTVEGYQTLEEVISDVELLKNNSVEIRDFILPSTIPTILELETNIFWDNILLNTNLKSISRINVANSIGGRKNVMEDRWRILLPQGTTDITQTFEIYFDNTYQKDKIVTANIKVLNKSIGSGLTKKIIFIGDSLTDNNVYEPELVNIFSNDVMNIELLGSRGSGSALHEGRSGWTTKHYCTVESYNNRTNAFFNSTSSKFDFSYYMNNQGYTDVDYVFINMGTNDLANNNTETLGYFKEMVASIKNYDNNITVFIGLCPPLSSQHDNISFKNKRIELMKLLLTEFDNRESEKIFINPLVLNFDAKNGFPTDTITGTRHNEELKVVTDNTHPLTSEYLKMADTIYCVIKYAASLE